MIIESNSKLVDEILEITLNESNLKYDSEILDYFNFLKNYWEIYFIFSLSQYYSFYTAPNDSGRSPTTKFLETAFHKLSVIKDSRFYSRPFNMYSIIAADTLDDIIASDDSDSSKLMANKLIFEITKALIISRAKTYLDSIQDVQVTNFRTTQ